MSGKSADMEFVNDQILHRQQWITVFSPVKAVLDNTGFIEGALWVLVPQTLCPVTALA